MDNMSGASFQENYRKRLKWYDHVRWMKEEHIVRRKLDVDTPGKKKKRAPKPKVEICVQERHDRGGAER